MTDIEDIYNNGSLEKDCIGKWTGNYCELYLLPTMVYIVTHENNQLSFKRYTLSACNTVDKLTVIIDSLDNKYDYPVIVQLINCLETKENEPGEVANIVNGLTPVAANELHFPVRIKVHGSKPSAFVLGILSLMIFILGIKGCIAWLQNTNPVDNVLFAAITIIPLIVAPLFAYLTYKLFIKVKTVNNTQNYGMWLTKKYLISFAGNATPEYVPLPFIDLFSIYKSTRPPIDMVVVAVKKPYQKFRIVSNWLTTPQTVENLKLALEQQIIILTLPPKIIHQTDAAIRYANGYGNDQKMYHLITHLKDVLNDNFQSKEQWHLLALYIDQKIANWPDDIKIIPEDWVFNIEVNENWEYGVNGVTYNEKLNGVNEHAHWLLPIGRVLVIKNQLLENYFTGMELNQLSTLLSTSTVQKIIFKISVAKYAPEKIKKALYHYNNLKNVALVFEKEFKG